MDESLRVERSRTFGGVAEVYDRARPAYPPRAVDWLTAGRAARVLELGSGTGKLTAQLVAAGHAVVASEPSAPMLSRLAERVDTPCVRAGAEQLPYATGTFDVVVAAQAYHWFDTPRALPEIARVLRDGGRLSLVWNTRDDAIPWSRRLSEVIGSEEHDLSDLIVGVSAGGLFEPAETAAFGLWQDLDEAGLLGLVASRSYVVALDEPERAEVLRRVRELYAGYGRGPDGLRLRYRTECYRACVVKAALPPADTGSGDGGDLLFDFR